MWQAVRRVLFWTYQRGSWQYDIIVLVILAFIFLTPTELFDGTWLRRKAQVPTKVQQVDPPTAKPAPEPEPKQTTDPNRPESDPPKP